MKRVIILTCIFMLTALLMGCVSVSPAAGEVRASGFIEARSYTVASEFGGTVASIDVVEGEEVTEGQELLRLDATALEDLRAQAEAAVAGAEAGLQTLLQRPRPEEVIAAEAGLAEARAQLDAAQAGLELLRASYAPFDMQPPVVELHSAEAAVKLAQAQVEVARAQLDQVKAGATEAEIAQAEAKLAEAQANLRAVEIQLERMGLLAPISGVVGQVLVNVGEVAVPGSPLMYVLDLDHLTLTVYVPETRVALISPGDRVRVTVDAYPGETFEGQVARVADMAQFTPSNVQTQEERVKLVFAVEISLSDPTGRLKPGMPADAVFEP